MTNDQTNRDDRRDEQTNRDHREGWTVVTGSECEDCGSDYRTSTAYGHTYCRRCAERY